MGRVEGRLDIAGAIGLVPGRRNAEILLPALVDMDDLVDDVPGMQLAAEVTDRLLDIAGQQFLAGPFSSFLSSQSGLASCQTSVWPRTLCPFLAAKASSFSVPVKL